MLVGAGILLVREAVPFFTRYPAVLTEVCRSLRQLQQANYCTVRVLSHRLDRSVPCNLKSNIHNSRTVRHYISFLVICSTEKALLNELSSEHLY
jgi:hypothetical protein